MNNFFTFFNAYITHISNILQFCKRFKFKFCRTFIETRNKRNKLLKVVKKKSYNHRDKP